MSTAVRQVRKSNLILSKKIAQTVMFDEEGDVSELELAKSRMNDEFISSKDFMDFMNNTINEKRSSQKANKRI